MCSHCAGSPLFSAGYIFLIMNVCRRCSLHVFIRPDVQKCRATTIVARGKCQYISTTSRGDWSLAAISGASPCASSVPKCTIHLRSRFCGYFQADLQLWWTLTQNRRAWAFSASPAQYSAAAMFPCGKSYQPSQSTLPTPSSMCFWFAVLVLEKASLGS